MESSSESLLMLSTGSHLVKYVSTHTSSILKSSKGRDKILGFIQYLLDVYKECMLDYLSSRRVREWPAALRNSKIIATSLKTGRKLFRLFRWIDETTQIFKQLEKPLTKIRLVKILKHAANAFYYLLDNLVWLAKIGIVSDFGYENWKWETAKNYVSIAKYGLVMCITFLSTVHIIGKENSLRKSFLRMDSPASGNLRRMLKYRSKRRFQAIEIVRVILRLFIVHKNLRLPFSSRVSTVFCAICGLIAESLSIFKQVTLKEEQNLKKTV